MLVKLKPVEMEAMMFWPTVKPWPAGVALHEDGAIYAETEVGPVALRAGDFVLVDEKNRTTVLPAELLTDYCDVTDLQPSAKSPAAFVAHRRRG